MSIILRRFEESRVKTGIFGKISGSYGMNIGALRDFAGESEGIRGSLGKCGEIQRTWGKLEEIWGKSGKFKECRGNSGKLGDLLGVVWKLAVFFWGSSS